MLVSFTKLSPKYNFGHTISYNANSYVAKEVVTPEKFLKLKKLEYMGVIGQLQIVGVDNVLNTNSKSKNTPNCFGSTIREMADFLKLSPKSRMSDVAILSAFQREVNALAEAQLFG